jgi:hypothetical protein
MIVSDSHRLVFLHIPKCAGSTVQHHLRAAAGDRSLFAGDHTLADGAEIDLNHVTLGQLAAYFPEILQKVRAYDSYAVLRDPAARLASSLAYYSRTIGGRPLSQDGYPALRQTMARVFDRLHAAGGTPDKALIWFQPQRDYVVLNGRRLTRHLFVLPDLSLLAEALRARHGIALDANQRINPARAETRLRSLLKTAARPMLGLLPQGLGRSLRRASSAALTVAPAGLYRRLYDDPLFQGFLADYYAEDKALYASTAAPADDIEVMPRGGGAGSL